jgi:hypothetical protein
VISATGCLLPWPIATSCPSNWLNRQDNRADSPGNAPQDREKAAEIGRKLFNLQKINANQGVRRPNRRGKICASKNFSAQCLLNYDTMFNKLLRKITYFRIKGTSCKDVNCSVACLPPSEWVR